MTAATQLPPLTVYTNATWAELPFRFSVGALGTYDDFTDYTLDASIRHRATGVLTAVPLQVTLPAIVAVAVPKATMAGVPPGAHDFELRKTSNTTGVSTIVGRTTVTVVAGLAA